MKVTLDFSQLTGKVKRSLSVIAKRSVDDKGNLLFKDITLGSLEEPILDDYYKDAVIQLKTLTDYFSSSTSDTEITLTFPTNHHDGNDTAIQDAFEAYCVSYALYSWFVIVAPRISQKYQDDSNRHLHEILSLIYLKQPPI